MTAESSLLLQVRYGSTVADGPRLRIATDGNRSAARLRAAVRDPRLFRDLMLTLSDVAMSDLRRKASDRSDYLAFVLAKGGKVTQELWDAQKLFLARAYDEAIAEETPLDPVLSIAKDRASIELFSGDESMYARLDLDLDGFFEVEAAAPGTTTFPFSKELRVALLQGRTQQPLTVELGSAVDASERGVRVPFRWFRALSEVQLTSTRAQTKFELAPIDLYNTLLVLRRTKAKKSPRALRFELVPGESPRIVLEPWDRVIPCRGQKFDGTQPRTVRTYGRNRLMVLARTLAYAKSVTVFLAGPGEPVTYVASFDGGRLTLTLSGWTEQGWSGLSSLDSFEAPEELSLLEERTRRGLRDGGKWELEQLAEHLVAGRAEVQSILTRELRAGRAYFDAYERCYRARELTSRNLPMDKLRFRDATEAQAIRLLEVPDQVVVTKTHDKGLEGYSVEGRVEDREARRSYEPSFQVDRDGKTVSATCACPRFRKSGLREGPCEHMVALRLRDLLEAQERERQRSTSDGRERITAETRTYSRRTDLGAETRRVSLDGRTVTVSEESSRSGRRVVKILFRKEAQARAEYFGRLERLGSEGFVDESLSS